MARIPLATVETPRAPTANGYVIYRGPSLIDGGQIIVIVTGARTSSRNEKTGDMVQTYILRADRSPLDALATGADVSICGSCIHRPAGGRAGSCYVNVAQAPTAIYSAWHRGTYHTASAAAVGELLTGRYVRVGSYGDPAAVPVAVWRDLIAHAAGHTGYTHQWREQRVRREYRDILMASVDTARQKRRAARAGWRSFRAKLASDARLPGEITCPASAEAGKRLTCADCGACDGVGINPGRASVVIDVHGLDWKKERFAVATR